MFYDTQLGVTLRWTHGPLIYNRTIYPASILPSYQYLGPCSPYPKVIHYLGLYPTWTLSDRIWASNQAGHLKHWSRLWVPQVPVMLPKSPWHETLGLHLGPRIASRSLLLAGPPEKIPWMMTNCLFPFIQCLSPQLVLPRLDNNWICITTSSLSKSCTLTWILSGCQAGQTRPALC